jgi:hypothetical protein
LGEFAKAYGLGAAGAGLVRPDGYVAWDSSSATGLADAVAAVFGPPQLGQLSDGPAAQI